MTSNLSSITLLIILYCMHWTSDDRLIFHVESKIYQKGFLEITRKKEGKIMLILPIYCRDSCLLFVSKILNRVYWGLSEPSINRYNLTNDKKKPGLGSAFRDAFNLLRDFQLPKFEAFTLCGLIEFLIHYVECHSNVS